MTYFSRQPVRWFLVACLLTFSGLVASGLHGYSIPAWHMYIDHSAEPEVLFGTARTVRNDDFALDLALGFAQIAHRPQFPKVNENIGLGMPMAIPFKAPLGDVLDVFRPNLWGFYLSPDFAMAWSWWVIAIGLLVATFLALWILTEGHFLLSISGAVFFCSSSFFNLWAFHKGETTIFGCLIFYALTRLLKARTPKTHYGWGLFLGWCLGCFLTAHFYPPQMIVVFESVLAIALAWIFNRRAELNAWLGRDFVIGCALAVGLFSLAAARFAFLSGASIDLIRQTIYPGQRVSSGGDFELWKYFVENFLIQYPAAKLKWGPLESASQASAFIVFTPLVLFAVAPELRRRVAVDARILFPSLVAVLLLAFGAFGFPEWLSKLTLLSMTTPKRLMNGIGLSSLFALAAFLAIKADATLARARLVWSAYGVFSALVVLSAHRGFPEINMIYLVAGWCAHMALAALVLSRWRRFAFVAATAMTLPLSISFNPLVRGGFNFIHDNALSRKMIELSIAHPDSQWMAIGATPDDYERTLVLSNLPRVLGLPSIGGASCPPEVKVTQAIRDDWKTSELNQCGHLVFRIKHDAGPDRTRTVDPGKIDQEARLDDPFVGKLGVGHVLFVGDYVSVPPGWTPAYSNDHVTILERAGY